VAAAIATAQRQLLTAVEDGLGAEHLQVAERLLAEDTAAASIPGASAEQSRYSYTC
jgi:hypothetical protein